MEKEIVRSEPKIFGVECDTCGKLTRLVGTEPHPVHPNTDLYTFSCTWCDAVQVVAVPFKQ